MFRNVLLPHKSYKSSLVYCLAMSPERTQTMGKKCVHMSIWLPASFSTEGLDMCSICAVVLFL